MEGRGLEVKEGEFALKCRIAYHVRLAGAKNQVPFVQANCSSSFKPVKFNAGPDESDEPINRIGENRRLRLAFALRRFASRTSSTLPQHSGQRSAEAKHERQVCASQARYDARASSIGASIAVLFSEGEKKSAPANNIFFSRSSARALVLSLFRTHVCMAIEAAFPTMPKERKKENRQPKGGMGERHAATTQGF